MVVNQVSADDDLVTAQHFAHHNPTSEARAATYQAGVHLHCQHRLHIAIGGKSLIEGFSIQNLSLKNS